LDDPLITEGFLGALCRDIEDSGQDDHPENPGYTDALSLGTNEIFTVVNFDEPTTPMLFLEAFQNRYPAHTENLWETAMNVGYQIDTQTPAGVTNLTSKTESIRITSKSQHIGRPSGSHHRFQLDNSL